MFDVSAFLDRAKAGAGIQSDYGLAKLIGVGHPRVSNWRRGENAPDERAVLKLCELSGDDPEHVMACIQSMRAANDDAASLWRRVAERLQKGYADVAMLSILAVLVIGAEALPAGPVRDTLWESVRYVKWMILARWAWCSWLSVLSRRMRSSPTAPHAGAV